jgi:hypothetical protein
MGPFDTERQAKRYGLKFLKLGRAIRNGEPVILPNLATVPEDVRNYITGCIVQEFREHPEYLVGKIFGPSLQ